MAVKRYNATLRNLEYRLRAFKDNLPMYLEDIVRDKEDVIVSAIADDQLYRRGINGRGEKIMSYMPYTAKTIQNKKRKGQPTTRVTLRDTGAFHESMYVVFDSEGFYVTASDEKTEELITIGLGNWYNKFEYNENKIRKEQNEWQRVSHNSDE